MYTVSSLSTILRLFDAVCPEGILDGEVDQTRKFAAMVVFFIRQNTEQNLNTLYTALCKEAHIDINVQAPSINF